MRLFIIRYNEIGLKSNNRSFFEDALMAHLRSEGGDGLRVNKIRGRIFARIPEENAETFRESLSRIPGIHSFSPAWELPVDMGEWKEFAWKNLKPRLAEGRAIPFRVTAQRSDKKFPMTSPEINTELGGEMVLRAGEKALSVSLKEPEINIGLEVYKGSSAMYFDTTSGLGGLPVGTAGKLLLLLSGGIDSPVAGYRMIRRGCRTDMIFFENRVFLGRKAHGKVCRLARRLSLYQREANLFVVPFADVQVAVRDNCDERYRVLLYRRLMLRIAQKVAERGGHLGLVTGENLGQVASQTLENMAAVESVTNLNVYRPLIADDKNDIVADAEKIGSFDISIEEAPDCCTVFMPRRPATRASIEQLDTQEQKLDIDALVDGALEKMEVLRDRENFAAD